MTEEEAASELEAVIEEISASKAEAASAAASSEAGSSQ